VSPEGVFTAEFWPFKNIGANYLPSLEPFIVKEVIAPSGRLLFSTVVACDLKWPDLDNIEVRLGRFIAAVGNPQIGHAMVLTVKMKYTNLKY
jgi:hypothetical protein